jgi:hypothetical protein
LPQIRFAALAAAALLLSCGAAGAAGPYRPFQTGLWSGGAYVDDRTGRFSHCSAGVVYDGGTNMFLVSTDTHGWWLGFTNPQWSLTPNTAMLITLLFDGRGPVELSGTATDAQLLLIAIPDDSHLIDVLRRSTKLNIVAQEGSFSLGLGGTAAVMSELTRCVRSSIAIEARSPTEASASQPLAPAAPEAKSAPNFASPPPAEAPSILRSQGAAEPEEIRLARIFLAAASLPNAKLIDTDKPSALASFKAVWKSENSAGAVKIIPAGPEVTGMRIASELISVDPLLCKGDFTTARSSETIEGGIVFSALLSCADVHSERTTQFFITPRRNGGFAVFAVIGDRAERGVANDRTKLDLFSKAAVQAVAPEVPGG